MNFAALDIGSNAVRMVIATKETEDRYQVLRKMRLPFRLGTEAFSEQAAFSHETIRQASDLFSSLKLMMEQEKVEYYQAFATSAFRDARNGNELAAAINDACGIKITRMSGELEAHVVQESVLSKITMDQRLDYLLVDLGGGSLELSQIEEGVVSGSQSFNLGTVRLLNYCGTDARNTKSYLCKHQFEITDFLDKKILNSQQLQMIGTGGNFRRLQKISDAMRSEQGLAPIDYIPPSSLPHIRFEMEKRSLKKRMNDFSLKEDQAEVITPALHIIEMLVDVIPIQKIIVPKAGLVDGILNYMVKHLDQREDKFFKLV